MNNSECGLTGMMHDYQIRKVYPGGLLEICTRCKDIQFFPNNIPNHIYLSYHLRQSLQKYDLRFNKEYVQKN